MRVAGPVSISGLMRNQKALGMMYRLHSAKRLGCVLLQTLLCCVSSCAVACSVLG